MTDESRKDARAIVVAVVSSALVGMGSAYLTANATLAKVQADQTHLQGRVNQLEQAQKVTDKSLGDATTELRVLNERLKRVDDIADSVKRVERKVDTALVRRTE